MMTRLTMCCAFFLGLLAAADSSPEVSVERGMAYGAHAHQRLDLYRPVPAPERAPLAVWIHGGGWVGGSRAILGPGAFELVRRGFVVASVDYRLAPAHPWPAQLDDVRAALRFLRGKAQDLGVDPGRIGVWGGSVGGQLAALLGLEGAEGVRAVVDFCGPADLTVTHLPDPLRRIVDAAFPRGPGRERLLQEASPIFHVHPAAPPFLIFHGELDRLVPVEQSTVLSERLEACGAHVELVIVKNAGHDFQGSTGPPSLTREQMGLMTVEFFERFAAAP